MAKKNLYSKTVAFHLFHGVRSAKNAFSEGSWQHKVDYAAYAARQLEPLVLPSHKAPVASLTVGQLAAHVAFCISSRGLFGSNQRYWLVEEYFAIGCDYLAIAAQMSDYAADASPAMAEATLAHLASETGVRPRRPGSLPVQSLSRQLSLMPAGTAS